MSRFRRGAAVIVSLVIVLVLAGCSFNGGLTIQRYVDKVKDDVHEAVNITREYKKLAATADCRNKEEADKMLDQLEKLSDIYSDLCTLEAPDHYDDLDDQLKPDSAKALGYVSEIRELITSARNTGDDTLYKQNSEDIMKEYDTVYLEIVDLSQQVTTRFRND